ncbi:MAG: hypothetical protein HYS22_03975 [Deltaproteobacteria bacterium]|nr:hypothetical protein [Deltaproteobacteria bacterium]
MSSENEGKAYQEMEKARLFDRVIGQSTKIHQRYEEIWSRVRPHWMDSNLTFNLYEGDRHPDYKKRFEEGMKNSPHKEDIEKAVNQANISCLTLTFDKARFMIEISKKV